jgi:hypothetical protein
MAEHPLLFGLWHAYAHCVKRTFAVFRHCWVALEYAAYVQQPTTTTVYLKPRMDALEQLISATYVVHHQRSQQLKATVAQCQADFGSGSRMHRLAQCMDLLVTVNIPCLFAIGLSVRECYWDLQEMGTGMRARDVLAICLVYLLALEKSERNEYCRVISMALLTWSPFLSSLPAAVFVEEVLEASLSRLNRYCATDLRTHTVGQFSDAYASMGPSHRSIDLTNPHMAETLPDRVLSRLDKCITALRAGTMPTVASNTIKSQGTLADTGTIYVPQSPLHDVDQAQVDRSVYHALYTLLGNVDLDDELVRCIKQAALQAPAVPPDVVTATERVHDEARRRLRAVLNRAPTRRNPVRPPVAVVPAVPDDDAAQPDPPVAELVPPMPRSPSTQSSNFTDAPVTDSQGRSSRSPSPACSSGSPSFDSADSRSPACTSGDENDGLWM